MSSLSEQSKISESQANTPSFAESLELSDAALEGLKALVSKLEPLLAGNRLSGLVDLISVTTDIIDMSDSYMVEKLANVFEEGTSAAWLAGNATRVASAEVSKMSEPPSLFTLLRMTSNPDVRRGLTFALKFSGALGTQLNHGVSDHLGD